MLIKWDTLLVAAAVAGGSMLIENSHRIDTTAPDDDVVATAPDTCIEVRVWAAPREGDDNAAVEPPPSGCSQE